MKSRSSAFDNLGKDVQQFSISYGRVNKKTDINTFKKLLF